ncbi:hypothetical protein ACFPTX_03615 [Pseudomonas sp. GCM10022188]|uniref:hypothetical protein n=1 Tax=Pseudomonas TaxID=286 RepID=UPI001E49E0F6|nr:hypothetical protein [Pseudomonas oryzagri]MCC6076777.1 hypothetical protein [Pseudomonas oryzagri]
MIDQQQAYGLPWRMLVCHKHPVSARLHFLIPEGGVVLPQALPRLAVIAADDAELPLQSHPASALRHLQQLLGIDRALELVSDFRLHLEVPGLLLPVYLAALAGYELCPPPPGTRWIELPQSIGMPWLDRELLRRVYEVLLG